MNINFHRNRLAEATIATGLLLGGFALAGSPVDAGVDSQIGQSRPQPAAPLPDAYRGPGVAFAHSEEEDQARAEAERREALILRAEASDRHLQTLADAAEQRALYEHIDNEADARAEAAADAAAEREQVLQAQGSDQHLENLAEQGAE
jgi:hypothetical protein